MKTSLIFFFIALVFIYYVSHGYDIGYAITTNDNHNFFLPYTIFCQSKILENMYEDFGESLDKDVVYLNEHPVILNKESIALDLSYQSLTLYKKIYEEFFSLGLRQETAWHWILDKQRLSDLFKIVNTTEYLQDDTLNKQVMHYLAEYMTTPEGRDSILQLEKKDMPWNLLISSAQKKLSEMMQKELSVKEWPLPCTWIKKDIILTRSYWREKIAFSHMNTLLALATHDAVNIYSLSNNDGWISYQTLPYPLVRALVFDPTDAFLYVIMDDGLYKITLANVGIKRYSCKKYDDAIIDAHGTLFVMNKDYVGKLVGKFLLEVRHFFPYDLRTSIKLGLSNNATYLIAAGCKDIQKPFICLFDTKTLLCLRCLDAYETVVDSCSAISLQNNLVYVRYGKTMIIIDLAEEKNSYTAQHCSYMRHVSQGTAWLCWNFFENCFCFIQNGEELGTVTLPDKEECILNMALSPDATYCVAVTRSGINLYTMKYILLYMMLMQKKVCLKDFCLSLGLLDDTTWHKAYECMKRDSEYYQEKLWPKIKSRITSMVKSKYFFGSTVGLLASYFLYRLQRA